MPVEQRKQRSNFAEVALSLWFKAVARRHGLQGLILTDAAGLLVGSSLEKDEAQRLAAFIPRAQQHGVPENAITIGRLDFQPIRVDEMPMFLCAVGNGGPYNDSLEEAEVGVQRILTNQLEGTPGVPAGQVPAVMS